MRHNTIDTSVIQQMQISCRVFCNLAQLFNSQENSFVVQVHYVTGTLQQLVHFYLDLIIVALYLYKFLNVRRILFVRGSGWVI